MQRVDLIVHGFEKRLGWHRWDGALQKVADVACDNAFRAGRYCGAGLEGVLEIVDVEIAGASCVGRGDRRDLKSAEDFIDGVECRSASNHFAADLVEVGQSVPSDPAITGIFLKPV